MVKPSPIIAMASVKAVSWKRWGKTSHEGEGHSLDMLEVSSEGGTAARVGTIVSLTRGATRQQRKGNAMKRRPCLARVGQRKRENVNRNAVCNADCQH